MVYDSFISLVDRTLCTTDKVIFLTKTLTIHYSVEHRFLCNTDGNNEAIFEFLNIKNRFRYCSEAYGYDAMIGSRWPESEYNDFAALTRVVLRLYKDLEGIEPRQTLVPIKKEFISKRINLRR